MSVVED